MSDEIPIGPNACPRCGGEYGEHRDWCKRSHAFAPAPGSPAPKWYSAEELHHWLIRQKYSDEIASELSADYAFNLQKAFIKGYEIGKRESKQEND